MEIYLESEGRKLNSNIEEIIQDVVYSINAKNQVIIYGESGSMKSSLIKISAYIISCLKSNSNTFWGKNILVSICLIFFFYTGISGREGNIFGRMF